MARIPDEVREAVETDLRAGVKSVRSIASDHSVGASTVSRIAASIGVEPAARPGLENAREANQRDYEARKSQIRLTLAEHVIRFQERMWSECTIGKFGGKDNTWTQVTLPEPPPDIQVDLARSIGIHVDKMAVLDRLDTGAEVAAGLIDELVETLRARRNAG